MSTQDIIEMMSKRASGEKPDPKNSARDLRRLAVEIEKQAALASVLNSMFYGAPDAVGRAAGHTSMFLSAPLRAVARGPVGRTGVTGGLTGAAIGGLMGGPLGAAAGGALGTAGGMAARKLPGAAANLASRAAAVPFDSPGLALAGGFAALNLAHKMRETKELGDAASDVRGSPGPGSRRY